MRTINKFISQAAVALAVAVMMPACSMDEPFKAGGEGTLNLTTKIKGDVVKTTRASLDDPDYMQSLSEKCVVYIESNRGLIRKFKGLQNINGPISLLVGDYVFEAWTGDSVSASFDKKFYRAYEKYTMKEGANDFTLHCNIANVIVSVNPESLNLSGIDPDNLKITFSHSHGSLDFDKNNISTDKGYFMMPNADKNLSYRIEGISKDGNPFEQTGVIENVQRAHEYVMSLSAEASENVLGGALVRIMIEDIPVIEDEVEIYGKPVIEGMDGFDLETQMFYEPGMFPEGDKVVKIRGYQGFSSLKAVGSENFTGDYSVLRKLDLLSKSDALDASLAKIGVTYRNETHEEESGLMYREYFITFSQSFFNGLPASDEEYCLEFNAEDAQKPYSKTNVGSLRIANTTAALGDPVATVSIKDSEDGYMSVKTTSATISGSVNVQDATGLGLKYREKGTSTWNYMPVSVAGANAISRRFATRAAVNFSITLKDLKSGTTYEYAAYCDDFDESQIEEFTTEAPFTLPASSFEVWSEYTAKTMLGSRQVPIPWSVGDKEASFWGSGNEGSATASMTLTDKSTDMVHSGTYSARLESKSALGVIAAGNLFIGKYVETDGTNGVLSLGRAYNGSHPTKMRVWANYRPASSVTVKDGNEEFLPENFGNGNDHGQIYVALTTEPVEIRTNPKNRKLFDAVNDATVVAYGQVTWTGNFGPDGALEMLEIPFEYNSRAKSKKPMYIIMVASASKYGDYFTGAPGSTMYLDDFELVYE